MKAPMRRPGAGKEWNVMHWFRYSLTRRSTPQVSIRVFSSSRVYSRCTVFWVSFISIRIHILCRSASIAGGTNQTGFAGISIVPDMASLF